MNFRSFLSCAGLLALTQHALATSYYYASPTGSDLNNGLTAAHPFQSIGHAISIVPPGSTVLLAPGNYSGSFNADLVVGHNVSLVATGTSANTIVDLAGTVASPHFGMSISMGVTFNVTGMTLENGYQDYSRGCGIISNGGVLNAKNCLFKNHSGVNTLGGAVYLSGGSATLTNCIFDGNFTHDGSAIATYSGANLKCSQCTFEHGRAQYAGAGLSLTGGTASMVQCHFTDNNCTYGVAFDVSGANLTIQQCTFTRQIMESGGDLVRADTASTVNIYNSSFTSNFGGGIADLGGGGEVKGCRFVGNQCGISELLYFGGLDTAVIANDLLANNMATNLIINDADLAATFCTFAENTCTGSAALVNNGYANISDCIFWDSGPSVSTAAGGHTNVTKTDAPETTNLDPLFVGIDQGDFHLLPSSPCIGVGDASATQSYSGDLDGKYRHPIPTIGCYESLTVDPVATSVGTDGFKRVLWFDTNGQVALWKLSSLGAVVQISKFTAPSGLDAFALAMGADNRAYIFLKSSAGNAVTVFTVATNGTLSASKTYTPAGGWDFKSADVSSDNALHLIWRNTFGTVLYWDVTAGGTTTTHTYGPLLG